MKAVYECLIAVMPEFLHPASSDVRLKGVKDQGHWIPAKHTAGMTDLSKALFMNKLENIATLH